MIKLPHDLYDHYADGYIAFLKRKDFDVDRFFDLISELSEKNADYFIKEDLRDDFLRTVLINPFLKESHDKYPLLKDYHQFVIGNNPKNPFADLTEIEDLKKIFSYSDFIEKRENHKKLRILVIEASGIEVCPYCNRQYIDTFQKTDGKEKSIAQLDHYYPKEKYPLYALSLYNFIPSCGSCNQGKLEEVKKVIYPFSKKAKEENKEPYFKVKADHVDILTGKVLPEIEYAFDDKDKKQHADFFHHESMYNNHQKFAQRLLQAQRLDNEAYLNGMNKALNDAKVQLNRGELRELLYGFNGSDAELLEKPLAKLARDIIPNLKKD